MARLPTLRCTKTAPGGLLRVFFQHVVSVRAPPLFSSHFFHFFRGKKTLSNSSHSQVHDLVGRHARVAAADPEVARGLARGHLGEEGRVLAGAVAGPAAESGTEFFFFGFFEVEVVSRLFDLAFFFFSIQLQQPFQLAQVRRLPRQHSESPIVLEQFVDVARPSLGRGGGGRARRRRCGRRLRRRRRGRGHCFRLCSSILFQRGSRCFPRQSDFAIRHC